MLSSMNTFMWMRWASISAKPEEGGEMPLDKGPLSMSLDNVAETLQCVLQLHRMVSCTIMPDLAPITLITSRFLDAVHDVLVQGLQNEEQARFVIIWDNVSFHRAHQVQNWFVTHPHFSVVYLPPYSPFLNPIEDSFSTWRWKVYDRHPYVNMTLLQAIEEACGDIDAASIQGWIRHSRRFFPRCLARENIACDVDEVLWPDPARRRD